MPKEHSLPDTIIGIDVETTSLDPTEGQIIEVSAIRYSLKGGILIGEETVEYTLLTKPAHPLSAQITAITGITQQMVADKPTFSDIKEELQDFIGDSLLFAHNAPFDINFLTHHGLKLDDNPVWDTFTLAGVAWPEATSYNLGMLSNMLNIKVVGEHRAGDDVRLTWQLLQKIYEQLKTSPEANQQIIETLRKGGQDHYLALFTPGVARKDSPGVDEVGDETNATPQESPPIGGATYGVNLSQIFAHRPEQLAMAQAVEETIKEEKISLIEAGAGTGNTFAYLVPLLLNLNKGAIISTHTKNLQDQLIDHDIPKLLAVLKLSYKAASLKGRRNYLCTSRLKQALDRTTINPEEAWLLVKLLTWLDQGAKGDLEQLNTSHQADHLLKHLHADALSCRTVCAEECPYHRARQAAQQADIVVVNHALLVQLGNDEELVRRSLGKGGLNHVVIDEARYLEDVAREATRVDLSEHRVAELVAPFVRIAGTKTSFSKDVPHKKQQISLEAQALLQDYQQIIKDCTAFLSEHAPRGRLILTDTLRRSTGWQKIVRSGAQLRGRLKFLSGLLQGSSLRQGTGNHDLISAAIRGVEKFSIELEIFLNGSAERIQWIEAKNTSEVTPATLHDVALSIKPQLALLFSEAKSTTLTSATLTTGANFAYITSRLGIDQADEKIIDSSFNFKDQMLIYIVDDGQDPTGSAFSAYTSRHIASIAKLLSGRTLGLFTSHESIRETYFKTLPGLNKANIKLLAQKLTGGRHNIMSRFQKVPASVLLGTYSFWEGVDVPGDRLSCVVIVRLPFSPPDDPVLDAVAASEDINVFTQLSVPRMCQRLRQGIGRLIRSHHDLGAIVILDGRFLRADYRDQVLKSLPPGTVQIGSANDLNPTLKQWFGEEKLRQWKDF